MTLNIIIISNIITVNILSIIHVTSNIYVNYTKKLILNDYFDKILHDRGRGQCYVMITGRKARPATKIKGRIGKITF